MTDTPTDEPVTATFVVTCDEPGCGRTLEVNVPYPLPADFDLNDRLEGWKLNAETGERSCTIHK